MTAEAEKRARRLRPEKPCCCTEGPGFDSRHLHSLPVATANAGLAGIARRALRLGGRRLAIPAPSSSRHGRGDHDPANMRLRVLGVTVCSWAPQGLSTSRWWAGGPPAAWWRCASPRRRRALCCCWKRDPTAAARPLDGWATAGHRSGRVRLGLRVETRPARQHAEAVAERARRWHLLADQVHPAGLQPTTTSGRRPETPTGPLTTCFRTSSSSRRNRLRQPTLAR
jgi:hypothetical protein